MSIKMNEYREQFLAEGREEGRAEGKVELMAQLVNEDNYDYDKALEVLGISEEEFSAYCTRPQANSL